ncbi:MAG TPA: ABC transporter substrate-binding protein [Casimicrobiaceae bacterium]|nr:ABC transporter substrate-binding protein [Casimicrobiaceae bacterium]
MALLAAPLAAALAQQPARVARIGYLSHPTRESVERGVKAFVARLGQLGWVEGSNLVIEYRWAEGDAERLPAMARELVAMKVDLIVAPAGVAALAAKQATSTIPIVMIFPFDPVGSGLVADLRRPGGNVTGTTFAPGRDLPGKQLQILRETLPGLARVAVLRNPTDAGWTTQAGAIDTAAKSLAMQTSYVDLTGAGDLDAAFDAIAREKAQALLVAGSSTYLVHRARIAELAIRRRLPTMSSYREMVEAGILMGYAVNMAAFVGHAAGYVDRILRGAKPGELAVEQPTRFELVVNARTARAIGLEIPRAVLQRADEVIG